MSAQVCPTADMAGRFMSTRTSLARSLSHRLLEGRAERMRRIDAKNLHLLGVERELLECEHEAAVFGVAFDIRIELRSEEVALDHIAFELGHIDAVGGKAAERLVERRGHVAHPKQERGNHRAAVARGPFCI